MRYRNVVFAALAMCSTGAFALDLDRDPLDDISNVCRPVDAVHRCDAAGAAFNDGCLDVDGQPLGAGVWLISAQRGVLTRTNDRFQVDIGSKRLGSCSATHPRRPCCSETEFDRNLTCEVEVPAGTHRVTVNDLTDNDLTPARHIQACQGLSVNVD